VQSGDPKRKGEWHAFSKKCRVGARCEALLFSALLRAHVHILTQTRIVTNKGKRAAVGIWYSSSI
jgi:hypothetical protein